MSRLSISVSLVTLLAGVVLPLQGERQKGSLPKVSLPQLQGPVVLDGRLDEPVWENAVTIRLATIGKNSEDAKTEPTLLRLWYDDAALYLGWSSRDADLRSTMTERDSRFWEEEVVEAFITTADLSEYFELEWNALDGVFDAVILNDIGPDGASRGIEGDWSWTATGMESAARFKGSMMNGDDRDEGWWVEARLPFAALGEATPLPQTTWRANFFRVDRFAWDAPTSSAWSPPPPGTFHQPSHFGFLVFGGPPARQSSSTSHSKSP